MSNNAIIWWQDVIMVISFVAAVFLIAREFFCWYWKINLRIDLLTEIRDLLSAKGDSKGDP